MVTDPAHTKTEICVDDPFMTVKGPPQKVKLENDVAAFWVVVT